jgi:hypothetical protein
LAYIYFPCKQPHIDRADLIAPGWSLEHPPRLPQVPLQKNMELCHRRKGTQADPSSTLQSDFDPEVARFDIASKSYLETCIRLWHLGDYFQLDDMTNLATKKLDNRCAFWYDSSTEMDPAIYDTTFIVDVESAIRCAWRENLASDAGSLEHDLRNRLLFLCLAFAPYLRNIHSSSGLLQELPQFAVSFSMKAMAHNRIMSNLAMPAPGGVGTTMGAKKSKKPLRT